MSNENESGFDIRYNHPDRYFEGHVYLRKKNFFKILLKMAYNRRYGEAEALKDLLGMRYETLNPNQENMANAVAFFQHEIFDKGAVYEQKGGLLDVSIIRDKDIQFNPIDPRKRGTNSKLKNGDITGTVSRKEPGLEVFTTGNVEMQFQNIGGMENGYNKTEIYELKKFLSAASRILKGFDIKNLKFFIQVFTSEVTGLSEQNILNHLFFPTEGWDQSMSPNDEHDGDEPSQENPAELWISKFWDSSHGFILPLKSKKGGVRFTTRDIISPSYFDLYNKSYLQPASISFDYLLKMYNRANVQKEVDTFKKLRIEMETNIHLKEI